MLPWYLLCNKGQIVKVFSYIPLIIGSVIFCLAYVRIFKCSRHFQTKLACVFQSKLVLVFLMRKTIEGHYTCCASVCEGQQKYNQRQISSKLMLDEYCPHKTLDLQIFTNCKVLLDLQSMNYIWLIFYCLFTETHFIL